MLHQALRGYEFTWVTPDSQAMSYGGSPFSDSEKNAGTPAFRSGDFASAFEHFVREIKGDAARHLIRRALKIRYRRSRFHKASAAA
jgi:hypothetical protein